MNGLSGIISYSVKHKHILPAAVHIPAYGGVLTPFRWMLREHAWQIAEDLGLEAEAAREPQEGKAPKLIVDTPWVQECDNQRALLEGFHSLIEADQSLVFFYARQTPMAETQARQIVAVARAQHDAVFAKRDRARVAINGLVVDGQERHRQTIIDSDTINLDLNLPNSRSMCRFNRQCFGDMS